MKKQNEEINRFTNETGEISVSENVISSIARNAISEIEGVDSIIGDNDKPLILGKNKQRGIKVYIKNKSEVVIEIAVTLKFGTNVIEVSKNIQEKVKESVESLIGMHVKDIDILVEQIAVN